MAGRRAVLAALALSLLAPGAAGRASGPALTAEPTVSGIVEAGSRLAAGTGTWTSSTVVSYRYQWYRCDAAGAHCGSIHGATGPGLVLGAKDVGKTVGLTVVATDAAGSTTAFASLVGPVAGEKPLLVSTAQPQIAGLAVEGRPLQVTTGAWSPMPTSLTYSWQRCNANGRICAAIAGANASAYTAGAADVGHALVALVQARFGDSLQGALSTATASVVGGDVAGPAHSAPPAIAGIAEQGAQVTGSTGLWTGTGTLAYAYQWYRCDGDGAHCSSIHGATKTTYRTVRADVGMTLGFTVRATDSTGTAAAYSSLYGPVAPAHAPVASAAAPALVGTAHPASTLTVSRGEWQPAAATFAFAWRRCNPNGRICAVIPRATQPSYTVTAADAGHALVAVVTAGAGPASQAAWSGATAPVS